MTAGLEEGTLLSLFSPFEQPCSSDKLHKGIIIIIIISTQNIMIGAPKPQPHILGAAGEVRCVITHAVTPCLPPSLLSSLSIQPSQARPCLQRPAWDFSGSGPVGSFCSPPDSPLPLEGLPFSPTFHRVYTQQPLWFEPPELRSLGWKGFAPDSQPPANVARWGVNRDLGVQGALQSAL